ncbi:HDOD domain-containing protein [Motiliproteus sp. MSK22-1]|uniref:HDOD domain-containing protein n=1 Tax=Motiliproteus sp. MSK22-1 TaxID=1897630 RepID=UPI00097801D8|nr:HDOD domain-containing protein [Motiliproteus sp. MSK22-1]OMH35305.1 hypothetical protein BGP75_10520 [Motiliproteus sp. MSK22-1]
MAKAISAREIASSFSIPPRPDALIAISNEMKKSTPDAKKIAQSLKTDVTLYATVLKMINSPLFGLRNRVTSVDHATMLLGTTKVFSLVKVTALRTALDSYPGLDRFWDTAKEVAHLSTSLASRLTEIESEDAYTVGMFHDCGIPLMMQKYPDFKELLYQVNANPNLTFSNEQNSQYRVNHYEVGHQLINTWLLPEHICEAIRLQPLYTDAFSRRLDVDEKVLTLLAILIIAKHISNAFRRMWRIEDNRLKPLPPTAVFDHLGLSEMDFLDIKDKCLEELETQE